jgi:hypothetical protein
MKKLLPLLLLIALLLTPLTACTEPEPPLPEGEPSLIVLPAGVDMIAIHAYGDDVSGSAYFDENNYGALLQLLEELQNTYIIATPSVQYEDFLFDDCFDLNVYGADGSLMQISVDKNNRICINYEYFTLSSGLLSYKKIAEYHSSFAE